MISHLGLQRSRIYIRSCDLKDVGDKGNFDHNLFEQLSTESLFQRKKLLKS